MSRKPDPIIAALQTDLATLGYKPGPIDGLAGPKTQAALWAFGVDHCLDPEHPDFADRVREAAAAKMGFSAYGVTQGDDPVAQALKGLIDNASGHEHQIAMLWAAIETLSGRGTSPDCVPGDAQKREAFDAAALNQLVR